MIATVLQYHPTLVWMQCEQLFLTAAEYSVSSQQNITPLATVCQEFSLVITITVQHIKIAAYVIEIPSC